MAYWIRYAVEVVYVPDGAGPMSVASAQKLKLGTLDFAGLTPGVAGAPGGGQPAGFQTVPGGNSPTQANFRSALTGATGAPTGGMALDLDTSIAANLTRIQGFATGGG